MPTQPKSSGIRDNHYCGSVGDFLKPHIHLYPEDWKKLPIPEVPTKEQTSIVELADRILNARRSDPCADVSEWEQEIDNLVYRLYGFTKDEIKLVEESTAR